LIPNCTTSDFDIGNPRTCPAITLEECHTDAEEFGGLLGVEKLVLHFLFPFGLLKVETVCKGWKLQHRRLNNSLYYKKFILLIYKTEE
jgi:hypothetical protein